jgi:geranylgeranyl reductase family protein
MWDVAVIGAGPAGLTAARTAAAAGARTLVLEKAEHPRYKTCGGGLLGTSLAVLAGWIDVPARDRIDRVTFTADGRREFTRRHRAGPLLAMVRREEFDDRLRAAAVAAGATLRQRCPVRAVEQDPDQVRIRLADGDEITARVAVGADGSAGVTARAAGVRYGQVDLGLEVELPVPAPLAHHWRGRLLLDWGAIPGSYAWVFPKGDRLTVGVIASRGRGAETRDYLRRFVDRLGLSGLEAAHDSGHLTRCRTDDSPLRHGRLLVAGDAAGLLEPWTREGISFALRSGELAGAAAAGGDLDGYERTVRQRFEPELRAGRRILAAFARRPGVFHTMLATPPGWRVFTRFCQGRTSFAQTMTHRSVRAALALLDGAAGQPAPRAGR